MRFYVDPLNDPAAHAELLLHQFKSSQLAIKHAQWVLTSIVKKENTRRFWEKVIEELKRY
jgi:hypothetical protein